LGAVAVVVDAARKIDDMTLNIVNRLGRERSNINAKEILLILNKVHAHTYAHNASAHELLCVID
jgi:hypothetical protein